jgi:hypothetical protein
MTDSLCRGQSLADFVALYRGRTVSEAELVAVSAEPHLVRRFFAELLGESEAEQEAGDCEHPARVLEVVRDE